MFTINFWVLPMTGMLLAASKSPFWSGTLHAQTHRPISVISAMRVYAVTNRSRILAMLALVLGIFPICVYVIQWVSKSLICPFLTLPVSPGVRMRRRYMSRICDSLWNL